VCWCKREGLSASARRRKNMAVPASMNFQPKYLTLTPAVRSRPAAVQQDIEPQQQ